MQLPSRKRRLQQQLPAAPIVDACQTVYCYTPAFDATTDVTINSQTGETYLWDLCWPLREWLIECVHGHACFVC